MCTRLRKGRPTLSLLDRRFSGALHGIKSVKYKERARAPARPPDRKTTKHQPVPRTAVDGRAGRLAAEQPVGGRMEKRLITAGKRTNKRMQAYHWRSARFSLVRRADQKPQPKLELESYSFIRTHSFCWWRNLFSLAVLSLAQPACPFVRPPARQSGSRFSIANCCTVRPVVVVAGWLFCARTAARAPLLSRLD